MLFFDWLSQTKTKNTSCICVFSLSIVQFLNREHLHYWHLILKGILILNKKKHYLLVWSICSIFDIYSTILLVTSYLLKLTYCLCLTSTFAAKSECQLGRLPCQVILISSMFTPHSRCCTEAAVFSGRWQRDRRFMYSKHIVVKNRLSSVVSPLYTFSPPT